MIKEKIRRIMYSVFSMLNLLYPKKKRVFVYGGEKLTDNNEAMLRYLAKNTDLDITCIAKKRMKQDEQFRNVRYRKNTFLEALIASLQSKVILDSSLHTVKMKPARTQLILQMWHGSPLKHLPESTGMANGKFYSFIAYSADLFKDEMKKSFGANENQMVLIGNPRNDYLFHNVEMPADYRHSGKTVIWMPTFRRGIGLRETQKDIPIIDSSNVNELEDFLNEQNIQLFIKPHPLQMGGLRNIFLNDSFSAIKLISDEDLMSRDIALYEFLGNADALITDYSSVYFDYLLLDRPIGFAIDDFSEYAASRGFALQPPENYMPGVRLQSLQDMKEFFVDLNRGNDAYSDDRKRVNDLVNYYKDGNSCERCADLVMRWMEK